MPLGFIAFRQDSWFWRASWNGDSPCGIPASGRRSGRIPALPYPPSRSGQYNALRNGLQRNVCRNGHRRVINTLILVQLRWPVLKWPRMAGFQVAAEVLEARNAIVIESEKSAKVTPIERKTAQKSIWD